MPAFYMYATYMYSDEGSQFKLAFPWSLHWMSALKD
jgi:hypothetical protein